MQCQGRAQRAAKQLSVEEDGEGVRSARRVRSVRGQGRATRPGRDTFVQ